MNEEQLKYIDKLAHINLVIFQHMAGGQYGSYDDESNKQARTTFLKNLKEMRTLLGLGTYRTDALVSHIESLQDIEENFETVEEFSNNIKNQLDDLQYPKVNRVYKMNLQTESKFDVIEEIVKDPKQAIYREPIGMETYTKEFWKENIEKAYVVHEYYPGVGEDTLIFDEDIISAAKNFMVGPCGAWRNKALLAETRTFDSLEELKENILRESQEKDMVLYKVFSYKQTKINWNMEPSNTFKELHNSPKVDQYAWRGVFLDKETEERYSPLTDQEKAIFDKYLSVQTNET